MSAQPTPPAAGDAAMLARPPRKSTPIGWLRARMSSALAVLAFAAVAGLGGRTEWKFANPFAVPRTEEQQRADEGRDVDVIPGPTSPVESS